MQSLEDIALKNLIFYFFKIHIVSLIEFFDNYCNSRDVVSFTYDFIIPHIKKLNLPNLYYSSVLENITDIFYMLYLSAHDHIATRECYCNSYNYKKNVNRNCFHEIIFQYFLNEVKKLLTDFDSFKLLWEEYQHRF